MTLLPALFFCLLTGAALSQSDPKIRHVSPDQTVDIGSTAHLECTVDNVGDYPVLWTRFDSSNPQYVIVVSTNTERLVRDERFKPRVDRINSTYQLQIDDVQDSDGGLYRCQVILSQNVKVTADVKLLVRTPPVFLPNSTNTVTVTEGVSVELQCYAKGYPPPQITWRRENNVAFYSGDSSISGNVLEIRNITKEDRGLYFCVADNGVGKKVKHGVEVNVKFAPVIRVPRPRVGQALHYNADLDCNVESYPQAAIYWVKNRTVLYSSSKYMTSAFSTPNGHVSSVLRVVEVEKADYGKYICNAANELGSHFEEVELFETKDPVCPPACNVQPVKIDDAKNNTTPGKT